MISIRSDDRRNEEKSNGSISHIRLYVYVNTMSSNDRILATLPASVDRHICCALTDNIYTVHTHTAITSDHLRIPIPQQHVTIFDRIFADIGSHQRRTGDNIYRYVGYSKILAARQTTLDFIYYIWPDCN